MDCVPISTSWLLCCCCISPRELHQPLLCRHQCGESAGQSQGAPWQCLTAKAASHSGKKASMAIGKSCHLDVLHTEQGAECISTSAVVLGEVVRGDTHLWQLSA